MDFQALYDQYGIYLLYVPLAIILLVATVVVQSRRDKAARNSYLAKYPNAAKVLLQRRVSVTNEEVSVHTVDGETPAIFKEKTQNGFYLKPGQSVVSVSYGTISPGTLYKAKNAAPKKGVTDLTLEVTAGKHYELSFDPKEKKYELKETS